eukprot:GGOE01021946.1.p1 GENE.GGOE01021946.1~~GGOE01021946.1.p1  ORF type:complete len:468 (+),score=132.74 GGOE01021946.1:220-1623(+)
MGDSVPAAPSTVLPDVEVGSVNATVPSSFPSSSTAPSAPGAATPPPLSFTSGISPQLQAGLVDYATWFREEARSVRGAGALLALLNRTGLPPNMRPEVRPRVMIANVGANGWADNLKCSIDLFLLSLLDRRLFFINARTVPLGGVFRTDIFHSPYFDWHHPDSATLIAQLRQSPPQHPQFATRSLHPEMGHVNLTAYFPDPVYAYDDFCCGAHGKSFPFFASLMGNPRYTPVLEALGLLQMPLEVAHGQLQRALFVPREALADRIRALRRLLTAEHIVGMHVRTKGPREWREVQAFLSPVQMQCMATCALMQGHGLQKRNATVQYFLALDNVEWLPQAREAFGDQMALLVTQPGSSPVHVGFTHKAPTVSSAAVLSTFADWFALAHLCTHLVLCPSGYGLTAAWRGMRPYLLFPYDAKQPKRRSCDLRKWCFLNYPTGFPVHWNFGNRDPAYQAVRPKQARVRRWPP